MFGRLLKFSVALYLSSYPMMQVGATEVIAVSESDCRFLARYKADDDVTYRPGFDARGNPVSPADIEQQEFEMPEIVNFDLLVGLPVDAPLKPEGGLGRLQVNLESGEVRLNGNELTAAQHQAVVAYCESR